MRGRTPAGPEVVERLDGSSKAKERLRVILETLSGHCRVQEACDRLGICEQRFRQLREALLQAALASLEDRPAGRPRRPEEPAEGVALRQQVAALARELQVAGVREEIALALPQVKQTAAEPAAPRVAAPKKNAGASAKSHRRGHHAAGGARGEPHALDARVPKRHPLRGGAASRHGRRGPPDRHPGAEGRAPGTPAGAAAAGDRAARAPVAPTASAAERAPALAAGHPPGGGRLLPRAAGPGPDAGRLWPAPRRAAADAAGLGRRLPARRADRAAGGPTVDACAVAGPPSDSRLREADRTGHRPADLAGALRGRGPRRAGRPAGALPHRLARPPHPEPAGLALANARPGLGRRLHPAVALRARRVVAAHRRVLSLCAGGARPGQRLHAGLGAVARPDGRGDSGSARPPVCRARRAADPESR